MPEAEVLFFKKPAEILSGPTALGRKKLAYPILKQKHGFYVVVEFNLEDTQELKELETSLRHNKNILRHLVIKRRLLNVFDKNNEKNFADEVKKAVRAKI
jgi:ribosomal protein S6